MQIDLWGSETGQRFFLSPDLFNIYTEMILWNIKHPEGVTVGGNDINNLRYADDIVFIDDSEGKKFKISLQ